MTTLVALDMAFLTVQLVRTSFSRYSFGKTFQKGIIKKWLLTEKNVEMNSTFKQYII